MNTQKVIQVNNLTKCFGEKEVLRDCSMTLSRGTIYGLLGMNGAGKTTLFKLLTGLLCPDYGSIEILGSDMLKERDKMLARIGSLIEAPVFYEHLSAHKNLELHLSYMGTAGMGAEKALQMVGLTGIGEKAVSAFSLGMRQRLGIARAIVHEPELLVLVGSILWGLSKCENCLYTLSEKKRQRFCFPVIFSARQSILQIRLVCYQEEKLWMRRI